MKPKDLREKLIELEKEAKFIEENKCYACLEQERIQHKIDQKAYDAKLTKWLARKGVEKVIEEKNAQLALLNDDLMESQDLVRQLEYNNTGLQGEIRAKNQEIKRRDQQATELQSEVARLRERYVDHCRDPGKDNVIMIARKHTTKENDKRFEYPYYISRI